MRLLIKGRIYTLHFLMSEMPAEKMKEKGAGLDQDELLFLGLLSKIVLPDPLCQYE